MPALSVMLKPASSACNLRCKYCFYHSVAAERSVAYCGMMTVDTYREVVKKAFRFTAGAPLSLSFQGGEPTLAGKDFFRQVIQITKEENVLGSPVFFGLQTNGTMLDAEWCDLLKEGGFLVGLSLDGDRAANAYRVDENGEDTFLRVVKAAELMQRKKVEFNILSVLTADVAERMDEIYDYFKQKGFGYLQFIPCLKPFNEVPARVGEPTLEPHTESRTVKCSTQAESCEITRNGASARSGEEAANGTRAENGEANGNGASVENAKTMDNETHAENGKAITKEVNARSGEEAANGTRAENETMERGVRYLSPKDYLAFLTKCFARYTADYKRGNYTSIRNFDNLVRLARHERAEQCGMNGHCGMQFVIEGDGTVYPCDFYCTDAYALGSILTSDFTELREHPIARQFIAESLAVPEQCKRCNVYALCRGGCKRERKDVDRCRAMQIFLPLALPHLKRML